MGNLNELLGNGFNAADHAVGDGDFAALPEGKYTILIERAEIKATKAGDGQYVALMLNVTGPTNIGRKVFDRILLSHPSEAAVRIGQERISSLLVAVGKPELRDTNEMIGLEATARLKVKNGENEVIGYSPKAVVAAAPTGVVEAPAGDSSAPSPGGMPWD